MEIVVCKISVALQLFAWRLAAKYFVLILIISSVLLKNVAVSQLTVIPQWNVTANETDEDSCSLGTDNNQDDLIIFDGSAIKTCSVKLIIANGTAAVIQIHEGALLYAEREPNIPDCQKKYLSFISDEPCIFVFRNPELKLFFQGDNDNSSRLSIRNVAADTSILICPEDAHEPEQHASKVSQTKHCQTKEFNHLIQCNLFSNYTCSFKFPANCNATLGNQNVEFQCGGGNLYNSLIVYPTGIIALDLTQHNIVNINKNSFKTLKSLSELYLSRNKLSLLSKGIFSGLQSLTTLYLDNNDITIMSKYLFTGLSNLNELHLDLNYISSLDENVFNETNKLTYLSLWENNLSQLPSRVFWCLKKLKFLDLDSNDLTVLPNGLLMELINLEHLYLGTNQINSLDEYSFRELIKLSYLGLNENNLTRLPSNVFWGLGNLTELELDYNNLAFLPKDLFLQLNNLKYLYLGGNQINSLHDKVFDTTNKLFYLELYNNNLKHLSNSLFKGLDNLRVLDLYDNKLVDVNKSMFRGLTNLQILYLGHNRFKRLDSNLFQHTRKISVLDLSGNELINIPDISNLWQLFYLNVRDNKMTGITNKTFANLPEKTNVVVSQHEICECYVSNDVICTAVDDRSPFLTCDRLLSDRVLMVVMWLIGLNAIGGNIFVLCQRMFKSEKNKTQAFLLSNLAMSDLLMGLYMLLIASADIHFGQYFPMQAEAWRSGITCRITGTISIVSSEASVFFVTLISIDRFVSIKYHNSRCKLRQKSSVAVAIVLWIVALILGVLPSTLAGENDKFYDNSHVCIGLPLSKLGKYETIWSDDWISICSDSNICYYEQPIQTQYLGEVNGMIFSSIVFLGLNFICYLSILACYIEIIRTVFKSSKRAGLNTEMKEQIRLTAKVATIVLTDFACWFPIIIIGILVQAGVLTLPPDVFAWCVTFVLPINSAINPYLYTIAAIINSRLRRTRITPVSQQENTSRRGQMFQSQNTQDTDLRHASNAPRKVTVTDESNV